MLHYLYPIITTYEAFGHKNLHLTKINSKTVDEYQKSRVHKKNDFSILSIVFPSARKIQKLLGPMYRKR